MNIAILEDNPAILDYLSTALSLNGHRVSTYTHGEELLEAVFPGGQGEGAEGTEGTEGTASHSQMPFDLILVDLLLPGDISGLQAMQVIREIIPHERLPIIIVSASSQKELAQAQELVPQSPVVRKPFKIQELLRLIDSVRVNKH